MQPIKPRVLTLILTPEQVKKLSHCTRRQHLSCTKLLARGTLASHFMQMLGIGSDRREMVKILMSGEDADRFLDVLYDELQMHKPGHGIAYATDVVACAGAHSLPRMEPDYAAASEEEKKMYQKITVVVDRGNADRVMDAARAAGARGGTILHGRGSTGKEAQKIFGIEIEEEKEVVVILTPTAITAQVFDAIRQEMDIDSPGRGIMYVEAVAVTRGLVENRQDE